MLEHMHDTSFDWLTWAGGGLTRLGLAALRFELIKDNADLKKRHAVGFLEGEKLLCRPKTGEVAVMFLKDEIFFLDTFKKRRI